MQITPLFDWPSKNEFQVNEIHEPLTSIDFSIVNQRVKYFANYIESHFEEIADILLEYESFEVVKDETARTLDLLRHLDENEQYFALRIGGVASFLPRNQPLYALTCFVIIPSLMASEVHFRIPHCMKHFFPKLMRTLKIKDFFPNIFVSRKQRLKFLQERSALRIDPKTEESFPVTDVVIFTGASHHAEQLRLVFDHRTLFIANGSGHNPLVVAKEANVSMAAEVALALQLYNQGQDCSAPNAILVHRDCYQTFMRALRNELKSVKVGHYRDHECRVGPISEPEDLKRIQAILIDNRNWLDPSTPGIIHASEALVEPTIICKPLEMGGNFSEVFAPIFFVQQYRQDSDLSLYFQDPRYELNAMYISLFGSSKYIDSLVGRVISGKVLHDRASILRDTHPHAAGVERGTQPYGGYGRFTSSLRVNGKIIAKPTLVQRDIYEHVVSPLLNHDKLLEARNFMRRSTKMLIKDVTKLLALKFGRKTEKEHEKLLSKNYVDLSNLHIDGKRYVELELETVFSLLEDPNSDHIAAMEPKHVHQIRALRKFLECNKQIEHEEFKQQLYSIPKNSNFTEEKNREEQFTFFQNIYQLLFGKDSGPRLSQFLIEADRLKVIQLLDL